jgi:hypothetical protein
MTPPKETCAQLIEQVARHIEMHPNTAHRATLLRMCSFFPASDVHPDDMWAMCAQTVIHQRINSDNLTNRGR